MMRVPYSWLTEYLATDNPPSPTELGERLALTGTEVERIHHTGVPDQPGLTAATANGSGVGYRVGRVLEFEQHPNADRLRLCKVDIGESEPQQIVCGASNFQAGDTVAVVLPGAVLPGGSKLGTAKLRGVESFGMMLSERELELGQGHDGIMLLTQETQLAPGDALAQHLPLSDHVLELEITSNRADCLSIIGVAREAAAAFDMDLDTSILDTDASASAAGSVADHVSVRVDASDLCPRYMARAFVGITVGQSPAWLRARLARAGMRAINNIVDVTNYVMLLTGQPLHAFDTGDLGGSQIVVRRAKSGEAITTLDGVDRTLSSDMLVIADENRPVVIAGIMGAANVEVDESTTSIILEAASFSGPSIIQTAAQVGLRSESSSRFEKGLDVVSPEVALRVASRLLVELCGAQMVEGTIDEQAPDLALAPEPVALPADLAGRVLGFTIGQEEQQQILHRLGVAPIQTLDATELPHYAIPHWRMNDLVRPIDLVEEVGRIAGLDRVPSELPSRGRQVGGLSRSQRMRRAIQDAAAALGLHETLTYSLAPQGDHSRWGRSAVQVVGLANPMTSDRAEMRVTMLGGHLESVKRNRASGVDSVALFEVSRTYNAVQSVERDAHGVPAFSIEREVLALCVAGAAIGTSFDAADGVANDFSLGLAYVRAILARVGAEVAFAPFTAEHVHADSFLHPGQRARVVVGGHHAGWVGLVHPLRAAEYDIEDAVIAAEVDLAVVESALHDVRVYSAISTYPPVRQDIAVVLPNAILAAEAVAVARQSGGELVESVVPFDRYEGEHVAEGHYSLALRVAFRAPDRTLTEDDALAARTAVIAGLSEKLGAVLR